MDAIYFEGPRRQDLLDAALRVLSSISAQDPPWLAREFLCRCLGFSRVDLQLNPEKEVGSQDQQRFAEWLQRFQAGEPLAYLEGSCGFFGRDFAVDSRVLIPRPDSECLIEAALDLCNKDRPITIADVGLGSGCLLFTLLLELPASWGYGIDLSADALAVAQQNCLQLGLEDRCELLQGSWLAPIRAASSLDLILSNPPYIAPGEEMGSGVEDYEPHLALFTPSNAPLEPYLAILNQARHCLREGGWLIFEVGAGRAEQVAEAGIRAGFSLMETRTDLGGVARAVVLCNQAQA